MYYLFFFFDDCTYSREIIDRFPHLRKLLTLVLHRMPLEQDLSVFA